MDFSMKGLIANIMLDIENFLLYIDEFGKPNCKYFNFVLNKFGLMHLFLYKSRVFRNKTYIVVKFVDNVLIALKKKFLEEKTILRRSALIFLISKIYFTDDVATNLKLRIIKDEWDEFLNFFNAVKIDVEYQDVCIMFCHLYTENFFRFTMKSIALALDYGENQQPSVYDITSTAMFWNELDEDFKKSSQSDVEELKQLNQVRTQVIQPFENTLPEVVQMTNIFNEFDEIEKNVEKFKDGGTAKKSRKEVLQVCRDYLKTSGGHHLSNIDEEIISIESLLPTKDKQVGSPSSTAKKLKSIKRENSSDSENEIDVLKHFYE